MKYQTIAAEFAALDTQRQNKMLRVRECVDLVMPTLLPETGHTEDQELPIPYSSDAARGTAGLGSRIATSIYPVNEVPFFQLDVTGLLSNPTDMAQFAADTGLDPVTIHELISQQAANFERLIRSRIDASNLRPALITAAQHLIVVGDCLLYVGEDNTYTVYRLDQYVVHRDMDGSVRFIILCEWVDQEHPPEILASVSGQAQNGLVKGRPGYEPHFTKVEKIGDSWTVTKEYKGNKYDTGHTEIPRHYALRWSELIGENYGRSLCEENIGLLRTCEALTVALVEAIAASAYFLIGVSPTGVTKVEDIKDRQSGDTVPARRDDVFPITAELTAQIAEIRAALTEVQRQVARLFLDDIAIQPTGERVTATQINALANAMDTALGGTFTALARDVQRPIALRNIEDLRRENKLPDDIKRLIDENKVQIRVRTGLEALGRQIEAAKLEGLARELAVYPPEAQAEMNWGGFLRRRWTASGLDPTGIILTPEERQARQQQAQQAAVQQAAAEQAIKSAGAVAEQQAVQPPNGVSP